MKKAIYSKEQNILVEKLRKAREDAGLDQTQAAQKLGTTQSYISKLESGQRRIDVIQLKELAKIYKKKIEELIP